MMLLPFYDGFVMLIKKYFFLNKRANVHLKRSIVNKFRETYVLLLQQICFGNTPNFDDIL